MKLQASAAIVSCLVAAVALEGFAYGQGSGHLDGLKRKIAEWEAISSQIQGEIELRTNSIIDGNARTSIMHRHLKRNQSSAVMIEEQKSAKGGSKVAYGFNGKYSFEIIHAANGWKLNEKVQFDNPSSVMYGGSPLGKNIRDAACANYPLDLFAGEGGYIVEKSETKEEGGSRLFVVNFSQIARSDGKVHRVSKGSMFFDTALEMSLVRVEVQHSAKEGAPPHSRTEIRTEYDGKLGDFPRPKSRVQRTNDGKAKNGELINTVEIDYKLRLDPSVPDTEFTLSAFGLPEPRGITWERPTPKWIWYGLGGLGLIAFGVWLRWWKTPKPEAKAVSTGPTVQP